MSLATSSAVASSIQVTTAGSPIRMHARPMARTANSRPEMTASSRPEIVSERRPVLRVVEVGEDHGQADNQDGKNDTGERRGTTPLPLLERQITPGTDPDEYEQPIAEIRVIRRAWRGEAKEWPSGLGRIRAPGCREQCEAEPDRDEEGRIGPGGMPGRVERQQRRERCHQRLVPVVVRRAEHVLPQHEPADEPQQVNSANGAQL